MTKNAFVNNERSVAINKYELRGRLYIRGYIIYDHCPKELCNMNLHLYGDSFRNNKLNCIITMIVLCN